MARKKKIDMVKEEKKHEAMEAKNPLAPKEDDADEKEGEMNGSMDLETLMRAKEIENDAKRMNYVLKALDKKQASIKSIEDLKTVYRMKYEKR